MKRSSLLARLITVSAFASLITIGCKKENSGTLTAAEEEQIATYSTEEETQTELVFNDVFDNVLGVNTEVGVGGTGIFGRVASLGSGREMNVDTIPSCTHVTTVFLNPPALFPRKITIDFGNGCPGNDGHTRYGKIITEYTGPLFIAGSSATTRFEGFKIDSIAVQGIHKITNTTNNTPGSNQRQFTVDVTDAKLTRPSGNYSEWSSNRVITQTEGNGTLVPIDDIFKITGAAHGRLKRGNLIVAWQSEITEPLIKRFTCHWISKGIIKVRRETLPTNSQWVSTLDYGQGTCDFNATLTINGTVHQIQLPH
jgi:hypothetical protein